MEDLLSAFAQNSPDLLILADDMHASTFQLVKDVRQFKMGRNPFILITMMVGSENDTNIKKAILAGSDDVLVKPVSPGKMLDRIVHFTFNRSPYIVTTDYLGPERRRSTDDRPSKIRQLLVVNTLRDKAEGRRVSASELNRQVERCMTDVMASRLDSHGLKLGYICNLILKAYEEKKIDKAVHDNLLVLVQVLEDAGRTAKILGEPDLADICVDLARQVEELAEAYENPPSSGLAILRKLTRAFDLAKQSTEKRFSQNAVKPDQAKAAAPPPPPAPVDSAAKGGDITISAEDLLKG
ncbi:MAG: response regulator [Rhodospirillaceae bacterium]|nr:response regulator [Rhodospirillaceae bacterium]